MLRVIALPFIPDCCLDHPESQMTLKAIILFSLAGEREKPNIR